MDAMELKCKLDLEYDTTTSENVKHFERMKELMKELIDEFNQIQYGANVKKCDWQPRTTKTSSEEQQKQEV